MPRVTPPMQSAEHSGPSFTRISLPQARPVPCKRLRENTGDEFEALKRQAHANMNLPGCKLQLYWRSFGASCGDQQRFEWRDSKQVKGGVG